MMTKDEIIEVLQNAKFATGDCYECATNLEFFGSSGCWADSNQNLEDIMVAIGIGYPYRIKPEPKYVPFTFEDAEQFWLERVTPKRNRKFKITITDYDDLRVYLDGDGITFEQLSTDFVFADGSPAGRLVE